MKCESLPWLGQCLALRGRLIKRLCLGGALLLLLPWLVLYLASWFVSVPALDEHAATQMLSVSDRRGQLLAEVRGKDGTRFRQLSYAEIPQVLEKALLAAEDARFYSHLGVDPIAVVRAAAQAVWQRRLVSGASTLTQQLARTTFERPRSLRGKLREMVTALALERHLSKHAILEAYFNRVAFGPNVIGVEAASHYYFDKPAARVDLVEAATLVAIPRGPTLYDPRHGSERVRRRRDRILQRLHQAGELDARALSAALQRPVRLQTTYREGGAEHLVRALEQGKFLATDGDPQNLSRVTTTLDGILQTGVQELTQSVVEQLHRYAASAAAVIVVDNATAEVLAYVGSHDFSAVATLGQNDGIRARRQPGSALKPFLYAAALDELKLTPASLLPDIDLEFPVGDASYRPRDYDRKFHGPVRLRQALASSLNVPAVHLAQQLTPALLLRKLHDVGFASLDQPAAHYGVALALGDGEVTLFELAQAYAALAQGGVLRPLRVVLDATNVAGQSPGAPTLLDQAAAGRRVVSEDAAGLITDILADPHARSAAFGYGSVLDFDFPVAAKTGTSKGYRDNWAVGFTKERTVAVWVGNFDGHPMQQSSGITGAGPLFHEVMALAMRGVTPAPLRSGRAYVERVVCALSGQLAGEHCAEHLNERFVVGTEPREPCTLHVELRIDPSNQLLAGPGCRDAVPKVFERYPPLYRAWASAAGRSLAPVTASPRCPLGPGSPNAPSTSEASAGLVITSPKDSARFFLDPALPKNQQQLQFIAVGTEPGEVVHFWLDGRHFAASTAARGVPWPLTLGEHTLVAKTASAVSSANRFSVE